MASQLTLDRSTVDVIGWLALLYMLPTLVAVVRRTAGSGRIARLNLRLGWTGIGWVVALLLALTRRSRWRG